jgi:hypothetical protein
VLKRITSPFKEFGWFPGLLYSIDRCLQRLSPSLRLHFYDLVVQPIPEASLLPENLRKTFEIREIVKGDPEVALMPARPDIKELRFEHGAVCLGAFKKERLAGCIWLSFGAYEEDEVRCTFVLPDDGQSVFDFDLYIMPESRMGLAFAGVWDGASQYLRERGVKFSYSRISPVNVASQRAHQRLGTRCVGRLIVIKAWALEFLLCTVSPYVHLSLNDRRPLRLKLHHSVSLTPASARRLNLVQ